jgi:hypothetical protein
VSICLDLKIEKEFEFEIQTKTHLDFIQASMLHSEVLFKYCSCHSDTRGVTKWRRRWLSATSSCQTVCGSTECEGGGGDVSTQLKDEWRGVQYGRCGVGLKNVICDLFKHF